MAHPNQRELGDFLRSRREKLSPTGARAPGARRRRTPGLRREEVAELAGIGVDWYVRLEQGRTVSPSAATIDALVRALALDRAEAAHLRALAESRARRPFAIESVPEAVRRTIGAMERPAYVTGRRWDVLAWNAAARERLADFDRLAEGDRNILLWMLAHPDARARFGPGWADEARRVVALFRATQGPWAADPAFAALLGRVRRESPEFAGWWDAHDVRAVAAGRKRLYDAAGGSTLYEHASFQSNDDPALKLVVYSPVAAEGPG